MKTEMEIRNEHQRLGNDLLKTRNQMLGILLVEKMTVLEWVLGDIENID